MSKIYIAKDAHYHLKEYLTGLGHVLEPISSNGIVDRGISNHPDIFLCKMGIGDKAPVYMAAPEDLGRYYPQDAAFNAACTDPANAVTAKTAPNTPAFIALPLTVLANSDTTTYIFFVLFHTTRYI